MTPTRFPGLIQQFIEALHEKHPSLDSAINQFFDDLGFREEELLAADPPAPSTTEVKDPIWGMVEFDEAIRNLLATPLLQRLRRITQLGLSQYTYPTATHTRFSHTIGVYAVSYRLVDEIARTFRASTRLGRSPAGQIIEAREILPDRAKLLFRGA
jgi:hypothetical protein